MSYLSKVKIEAMSRGVIVLDQNIETLKPFLQERNIKVIEPPTGMKDPDIIRLLLPHRILVTNNVIDFKKEASSFEFGIIGVPKSLMANPENAAALVSKALTDHKLWAKRHGFLVTLSVKGKSTMEDLKD